MIDVTLRDGSLMREAALIGGRRIAAEAATGGAATNPATGDILGCVPDLGAKETHEAIDAAKRIYVQSGVYDAFATKLADAVGKLPTGNGFDSGAIFGPLIDAAAVDKVKEHVSDAVSKGAEAVLGREGSRHGLDDYLELKYTCMGGIEAAA